MLAVKFIELENSDNEVDHQQLAAESCELLAAARLRWGPWADKAERRKELFKKFPELWKKRAHEVDCRKPENEDGERPPKEVLNFETNKKINAEKEDCTLVPGMPLRMGSMYKNVRPQIMHLLISLYGGQAFVNAFGKNAVSISLSSLDEGNMATFKEHVEPRILPVLVDPRDNDEAKEKKEHERELLKKMAEEESLLNEDLFMSQHVKDTPLTKAEIGNHFLSEASNSSIWKESKTLKDQQAAEYPC